MYIVSAHINMKLLAKFPCLFILLFSHQDGIDSDAFRSPINILAQPAESLLENCAGICSSVLYFSASFFSARKGTRCNYAPSKMPFW